MIGRRIEIMLAPLAILALPAAALAGQAETSAETACPAKPAPLPGDLLGWSAPSRDRAMTKYYPRAHWLRGLNTSLGLNAIEKVAFVATPGTAIEPGSFGGLMSVRVQKVGRLKIALDGPAWIDLVKGKALLPSVGHDHGPGCTTIAKVVEYDVEPGRYIVQIVNAPAAKIHAMAVAPH